MSKISVPIPPTLDARLDKYIPWGSKGAIIMEMLYQLVEKAERDGGKSVYQLIKEANNRATS